MNPNVDMQAIQEVMRRRAGQMPSTAGIPGGAPAANSPSITNPIAVAGMARQPANDFSGMPGSAGYPSTGPIQAMQNAKPGEAELIAKALIQRYHKLPSF